MIRYCPHAIILWERITHHPVSFNLRTSSCIITQYFKVPWRRPRIHIHRLWIARHTVEMEAQDLPCCKYITILRLIENIITRNIRIELQTTSDMTQRAMGTYMNDGCHRTGQCPHMCQTGNHISICGAYIRRPREDRQDAAGRRVLSVWRACVWGGDRDTQAQHKQAEMATGEGAAKDAIQSYVQQKRLD